MRSLLSLSLSLSHHHHSLRSLHLLRNTGGALRIIAAHYSRSHSYMPRRMHTHIHTHVRRRLFFHVRAPPLLLQHPYALAFSRAISSPSSSSLWKTKCFSLSHTHPPTHTRTHIRTYASSSSSTSSKGVSISSSKRAPEITLYQYDMYVCMYVCVYVYIPSHTHTHTHTHAHKPKRCPFCNKVKAHLDYFNVPYKAVEVYPLKKPELSFSHTYKKVPVLTVHPHTKTDKNTHTHTHTPDNTRAHTHTTPKYQQINDSPENIKYVVEKVGCVCVCICVWVCVCVCVYDVCVCVCVIFMHITKSTKKTHLTIQ